MGPQESEHLGKIRTTWGLERVLNQVSASRKRRDYLRMIIEPYNAESGKRIRQRVLDTTPNNYRDQRVCCIDRVVLGGRHRPRVVDGDVHGKDVLRSPLPPGRRGGRLQDVT